LLYGIYLAFCFATPVLGGFLADKWVGCHRAMIAGAIFLMAGNLLLLLPALKFVYLGLAFTISGTGLYKANCTSLVGNLYADHLHKERGLTLFYAGMNLGAALAPIFYGIILISLGWQYGFLLNAVGIFIGLILYLFKIKSSELPQENNLFKNNFLSVISILFFVLIMTGFSDSAFYYPAAFEYFLGIFGSAIILLILIMAIKKEKMIRNQIFAVLLLDLFCVFFFALTLQIGSSITMFIQLYINRTFFHWQIPTIMFSAFDPLFFVLAAPVFAALWSALAKQKREPFIMTKVSLSFILLAFAFLSFMLAAQTHQEPVSLLWVILGDFFLGAGEICLAAPVLSVISQFMPKNLQGTMMGVWFLAIAFAGFLSGILAELTDSLNFIHTKAMSLSSFNHVFLAMVLLAVLLSVISFAAKPVIKKWLIRQSTSLSPMSHSH